MVEEPSAGQDAAGNKDAAGRRLERAVLLALLGAGEERCQRAELAATIGGETQALEAALRRLCEAGAVCAEGAQVWASPAARHIDELGLIAI